MRPLSLLNNWLNYNSSFILECISGQPRLHVKYKLTENLQEKCLAEPLYSSIHFKSNIVQLRISRIPISQSLYIYLQAFAWGEIAVSSMKLTKLPLIVPVSPGHRKYPLTIEDIDHLISGN